MAEDERSKVQYEWQQGKIQVIAVPTAYGMAVVKPDILFVVHFSIPSSLEVYYQETSLAGCDDLPATCILYFAYQGVCKQQILIEQSDGDLQQKTQQNRNLNTMIKFVGNETDCRRKQIMDYFGEKIESSFCNNMCDNCICNQHRYVVLKDMSREAAVMINLLQRILTDDITLNQLSAVYHGSKNIRIKEKEA